MQGWDTLHGNLLQHGWINGDAPYYTLEVPLLALSELAVGLGNLALHAASAVTYLLVAGCAAAVAVAGSRGAARAVRAGIVIAVLAACALVPSDVWIVLGPPDHIGTSAFLLVAVLLIDRVRERRYAAPVLLCAVLCAGQLSDAIVRYVYVPAIVAVGVYRVFAGMFAVEGSRATGPRAAAARAIRSGDLAFVVAALASVPLESAVRWAMAHAGGYRLRPLSGTQLAPPREWPHNAALTAHAIGELFGVVATPGAPLGDAGAVFGIACLLAVVAGLARVIWHWRTASRAEQILCAVVAVNLGAYCFTTMPRTFNPHELAVVLPCGAILAARALVPERIASRVRARRAVAAAVAAALLPLTVAAVAAPAAPPTRSLASWLEAHRLTYGLSSYWDGSATTVDSGGRVALRTIIIQDRRAAIYAWETNTSWFDPSRYDATFVVIEKGDTTLTLSAAERAFGKPVATDRVASWRILIYDRNLLRQVRA